MKPKASAVPDLCIDPFLISLPKMETSTKDDIEDYVSGLIDWSKTIGLNHSKSFVSSAVLDAIEKDDAHPWLEDIQRLLKQNRVQSVDCNTVFQSVQFLLSSLIIEDELGLKALLLDENKTELEPSYLIERLRPKTQSAFFEMLAMIILIQHGYGRDADYVAVASLPDNQKNPGFQFLRYSAEISIFEEKKDTRNLNIKIPYVINDQIPAFFSREGLLEKLEPISIWLVTDGTNSACDAIDCCVARLVAAGSPNEKISYSMGSQFLSTAQIWDCGQEGRYTLLLIESCARIVLNNPKNPLKPFLDEQHGKQKIRNDGALAFRTHLTKGKVALRLMLWKLADGTIEFANVGKKAELKIL